MRLTTRNSLAFTLATMLIRGSCVFAMGPQDATHDEIGNDIVTRIKQDLKEPFLTLLASSEFTNKTEFSSRIKMAENALSQFKSSVQNQLGMQPVMQQPVQPMAMPLAPQSTALQVPQPVPMTMPAQMQQTPAVQQPQAVPTMMSAPAQSMEQQSQAMNVMPSTSPSTMSTQAVPAQSESMQPLATPPPQQPSPFQTPPGMPTGAEAAPAQPATPQPVPPPLPATEEHLIKPGSLVTPASMP